MGLMVERSGEVPVASQTGGTFNSSGRTNSIFNPRVVSLETTATTRCDVGKPPLANDQNSMT